MDNKTLGLPNGVGQLESPQRKSAADAAVIGALIVRIDQVNRYKKAKVSEGAEQKDQIYRLVEWAAKNGYEDSASVFLLGTEQRLRAQAEANPERAAQHTKLADYIKRCTQKFDTDQAEKVAEQKAKTAAHTPVPTP